MQDAGGSFQLVAGTRESAGIQCLAGMQPRAPPSGLGRRTLPESNKEKRERREKEKGVSTSLDCISQLGACKALGLRNRPPIQRK
jgi:hypothetical protein